MEGEHFGIAPMEALASGCVTLVHDSGGSGEFVLPEFRWKTFEDLRSTIAKLVDSSDTFAFWNKRKDDMLERISVLQPEKFEAQIWSYLENL
jgi:glycosyltransferase involved in cell wall biosynthesis